MKWKLVTAAFLILLLSGCAVKTQPQMETVSDPAGCRGAIAVAIPEDMTKIESEDTVFTSADGRCVYLAEVLEAGTAEEAIAMISGFPADRLSAVTLEQPREYRFSWAGSGEEGDTVSRCVLRTDGTWFYALTMTAPAAQYAAYAREAAEIFASFRIDSERIV